MYKDETIKKIVEQMNKLFVTYRGKYVMQTGEGQSVSYITTKRAKLTDNVLVKHIIGDRTVGVKLGNYGLTRFLTFDIDIKDVEDRKQTAHSLVELLNEYYGIPMKDIHVWYSGSKGYHVDLYFDDVIPEQKLLPFYNEVLMLLSETSERIERRPTCGQGVKLPLGIHLGTGKTCPYVDNQTLKPLPTSYFLNIEPQSLEDFKENVLDEEFQSELDSTLDVSVQGKNYEIKIDGRVVRKGITDVLKAGHLLSSGTRNNFTHYGSRLLKSEGHSEEDTFDILFEVLRETYTEPNTRKYLKSDWTLQTLAEETRRVVQLTYKKGYSISSTAKEVTYYQSEMDVVMSVKSKKLRRLLFSLLHHSKKYASEDGTFFCTHKILADMGNDSNAGRSMKNIRELESMGLVIVVSSRIFLNQTECAPNIYKVLLNPLEGDELKLTYKAHETLNLEQVINDLERIKNTGGMFIFTYPIYVKEYPSN